MCEEVVLGKFQAACIPKITVELTTFLPCILMSKTECNEECCGCFTTFDIKCSCSNLYTVLVKWQNFSPSFSTMHVYCINKLDRSQMCIQYILSTLVLHIGIQEVNLSHSVVLTLYYIIPPLLFPFFPLVCMVRSTFIHFTKNDVWPSWQQEIYLTLA